MRTHGRAVAHQATFKMSEPDSDGFFTVTVTHGVDTVVASGYGDNVEDALLEMVLALLPPDHPDFDAGPSELSA